MSVIAWWAEPFSYGYMLNAFWVSALVAALCGVLSAFLTLKGWSLIGDALSHAVVPGVAGAWMLGLPLISGAFIAAALAAGSMLLINRSTVLRTDAIIGVVFTGFFGLGLFMLSLSPASVNIDTIIFGNILAIDRTDALQLLVVSLVCLLLLALSWKSLMLLFFDEKHARTLGIRVGRLRVMFFMLLSAATVVALQAVGAFLVVAMVITPGATAYLLTDRFGWLVLISASVGVFSALLGTWLSFYLDGATGGVIVLVMTALFALAFVFGPTHGQLAHRRRERRALNPVE